MPEISSVIVAAGTITSVGPGDGIAHDPVVDEAFEVVAFDDPSADERNIVVTMDVSESAGEAVAGESLVFRMGVIGGADPQRFLESVRGLKDVVVVLDRLRDGRSKGDLVPAVGPLLGPLATDGSFSLPALGEDEAAFVGELDTVGELLEAASGPAWVSRKTLGVHSK